MKWSFATAGLIILGLFGLIIIILFHEITVSNEQDYYTLKDATEAAMIEAVDVAYYRLTGDLKISKEKFVENFTRRFTETSTFGQGNYNIEFYQISESPAKISIRITDNTNSYNIYQTFDPKLGNTDVNIVNEISAILDGLKINIDIDDIADKLTAKEAKECKKEVEMAPKMDCTPKFEAVSDEYVTYYEADNEENTDGICYFRWKSETTWTKTYAPEPTCDSKHKYDKTQKLCVCKEQINS